MPIDPLSELHIEIEWPDLELEPRDDYYSPHKEYLELDESLEAKIGVLQRMISELEEARDQASSATLDSHTGSAALAMTDGDTVEAASLIVEFLNSSWERANHCVECGNRAASPEGASFLSRLFGQDIDPRSWDYVHQVFHGISDLDGSDDGLIPLEAFYGESDACWDELEEWNFLEDRTTLLQSAVMLSGTWRDPSELAERLPIDEPYEPDIGHSRTARFLAGTYALLCLREQGVVLEEEAVSSIALDSALAALEWILPLAAPENGESLDEVIRTVHEIGLGYSRLDEMPFELDPDSDWVNEIRNTAASINHYLTRTIPPVTVFRHRFVNIVLADAGETVIAWVGNRRVGVLTSFDKEHFVVSAMPSPASAFAAGCAISLYVDLSLNLRGRQIVGLEREPGRRNGRRSVSIDRSFDRQVRDVSHGTHAPPKAHYVAPHIRHLMYGRPNRAHVALAPERLRNRMGPNDTWVSGHVRGRGNESDVIDRLRHYSMLADALGLLL